MPSRLNCAQQPVVGGHGPFALVDLHRDRALVVVGRAEDVLLLGRDGGVALDELGHDAAQGLDAQRQRRDVQEQDVLDFARQHAALDRRADGHDLVRVDALVRLLAEHRLDDFLHLGDAGRTADQHHFVDLAVVEVGVLHGLLHRAAAAIEEVIAKLLELRPVERDLQVLGARGVGRDERQVDIGRLQRAQFLLGLFAGLLEPLQGHRILAEVDAVARV